MKRWVVLAILAVVGLANAATAQMMTYMQDGEPAFSLTFPDGWEIRTPRVEGRNVISAYPTDGSLLWLGMWIMRQSTSVDDAVERLKAMELGLFEDVKLLKEPWTESVGGFEARCYKGTGRFKGETTVESFMAFFELPGEKVGALGFIGEPDGVKAHQAELETLLRSLEAAR